MPSADIMVSVACTTFNHAAYIRQCLDGFLMQQTNFRYEIVLYDDASTDGTQQIIEEYVNRYPEIIFPLFQSENQYSQGVRGMMARFNFPRCRGKYIALCEGDDYWTDPLKLQKQVDFMEQHPDYTFSMGRVNFLYQETMEIKPKKEFVDPGRQAFFTLKDYLKQPFSQTASFLFRNNQTPIPEWIYKVMAGDQSLVVIMTGKHGKIKFHDEVFSVYRINKNSLMQGNMIRVLKNNFDTFRYWNEYLDYEFNGLLRSRIIENYILYYLFKPKFVQRLYKNYIIESILQFFYKAIMALKNTLLKAGWR